MLVESIFNVEKEKLLLITIKPSTGEFILGGVLSTATDFTGKKLKYLCVPRNFH